MRSFLNRRPDKIELDTAGDYKFIFGIVNSINSLITGSEFSIVYSPSKYYARWHVIGFKRVRSQLDYSNVVQVEFDRALEQIEIAYFEKLLIWHQQEFTRFAEALNKGVWAITFRSKPESSRQTKQRRYEAVYWFLVRLARRLFMVNEQSSRATRSKYRRVLHLSCSSVR